MCDLDNLQFDCTELNTKLAKEYLERNEVFYSSLSSQQKANCKEEKKENLVLDSCNNKIYCYTKDDSQLLNFVNTHRSITDLSIKMASLIEKLRSNSDLFAQLDYMIRHRAVEEGKLNVDLIIKQFMYWSQNNIIEDCKQSDVYNISMTDDKPLLVLGCIAYGLQHYNDNHFCIYATKQVAVVSHLFVSLCTNVGFSNIYLVLVEEPYYLSTNVIGESSCTGIITERSDFESAFDVFRSSTTTSPWSLNQIYVQESIYEDFKRLMAWKCKKTTESDSQGQNRHDSYEYDDKIFVLDGFDIGIPSTAHIIHVEAYRTTKEVLSLVAKYRPQFVSLWASDISEANEIAHGVNSNAVWVNSFGTFQGPAEVSNTVYLNLFNKEVKDITMPESSRFRCIEWEMYDLEKRRQIILKALENFNTAWLDYEKLLVSLKNALNDDKNFVDVSRGIVSIGIRKPIGMVCLNSTTFSEVSHIARLIASLQYGNFIVISENVYKTYKDVFDTLFKCTPIFRENSGSSDESKKIFSFTARLVYPCASFTDLKVIWTNFGTIFAN